MSKLFVQKIGKTVGKEIDSIAGQAKAWINMNGATPVINDSFNVDSLIDNGTGDYGINYIALMDSINYAVLIGGRAFNSTVATRSVQIGLPNAATSTTAVNITSGSIYQGSAGAFADVARLDAAVMGDLA